MLAVHYGLFLATQAKTAAVLFDRKVDQVRVAAAAGLLAGEDQLAFATDQTRQQSLPQAVIGGPCQQSSGLSDYGQVGFGDQRPAKSSHHIQGVGDVTPKTALL